MLMGTKWARDFLFNQNFILTFLNHTLAFKKKKHYNDDAFTIQ